MLLHQEGQLPAVLIVIQHRHKKIKIQFHKSIFLQVSGHYITVQIPLKLLLQHPYSHAPAVISPLQRCTSRTALPGSYCFSYKNFSGSSTLKSAARSRKFCSHFPQPAGKHLVCQRKHKGQSNHICSVGMVDYPVLPTTIKYSPARPGRGGYVIAAASRLFFIAYGSPYGFLSHNQDSGGVRSLFFVCFLQFF